MVKIKICRVPRTHRCVRVQQNNGGKKLQNGENTLPRPVGLFI